MPLAQAPSAASLCSASTELPSISLTFVRAPMRCFEKLCRWGLISAVTTGRPNWASHSVVVARSVRVSTRRSGRSPVMSVRTAFKRALPVHRATLRGKSYGAQNNNRHSPASSLEAGLTPNGRAFLYNRAVTRLALPACEIPAPGYDPEGMHEFKVDFDGDAIEDLTYRHLRPA